MMMMYDDDDADVDIGSDTDGAAADDDDGDDADDVGAEFSFLHVLKRNADPIPYHITVRNYNARTQGQRVGLHRGIGRHVS